MSRRTAGVLLAVVAAALAVVGTFLPLSWIGASAEPARFGLTTTGWTIVAEPAEVAAAVRPAQLGVPIVIAALLLVIAAALVVLPEHQRSAARYTAVGATGLLAGAVWTTFMVIWASARPVGEARSFIDYRYGEGLWLLVVSVVAAVVATVLMHSRRSAPRTAGAVVHRVGEGDDDTPPFGIAVAVLPEETEPPTGDDRAR
ncbi:hypothetical protein [Saccharothrix australiensis]|uniref:Uncharacterized protein n=1 Tax=Saccharothrix australiensis TaxID=2072 RepID=A0A495W597_9PSEU|nr:hypothetical protein [Saccharothrix australiensis]RKT56609.1 hypothetical protein C8E97_5313 [Saccharothrix australiensis]